VFVVTKQIQRGPEFFGFTSATACGFPRTIPEGLKVCQLVFFFFGTQLRLKFQLTTRLFKDASFRLLFGSFSGSFNFNPSAFKLTSIAGAYGYGTAYDVGSTYLDGQVVNPGALGVGFGTYPLTVTYVAGRAVVPQAVQWAVKEIVRALWASQRGPGDLQKLFNSGDVWDVE